LAIQLGIPCHVGLTACSDIFHHPAGSRVSTPRARRALRSTETAPSIALPAISGAGAVDLHRVDNVVTQRRR